jgi:hypothetical protein
MQTTRILIGENAEMIGKIDQAYAKEKNTILERANAVMALFSEFDATYGDTGTTTVKYNQLLTEGAQSFIDAAINTIKSQFTTAGITSAAVINVAIASTEQKGNGFLKAYNELLQYLQLPALYPELKFALSDVKFVNGLAALKAEKNLEALKDIKGRWYIDTQSGYTLVDKAVSLVAIFNSINDFLKSNRQPQITSMDDFSKLAKYKHSADSSIVETEVNNEDIYYMARKIDEMILV